jgi:hypothetical protein
MKSFRLAVGAFLMLGTCLLAAPASADPATANSLQLGLGFRYGIEMNEGDFNPWGLGLGLSGGYTLPNAIYLGGNFEYFFGDKITVGTGEVSGNLWQLTAEGGYDIGLGPIFVLRPKLGAGIAGLNGKVCVAGACSSSSDNKLVLAPGATFLLMPPGFLLTVDARYDLILADPVEKALILTVGIGF